MSIQQYPAPKTGIPSGATGSRPSSPVIGDTFYNGTTAILEIWDGSNWVPCSSVPDVPSISVADVGTSAAYGAAKGLVTITPAATGIDALGYRVSTSANDYSVNTSTTTAEITVGNNGTYSFVAVAYSNYGVSVPSGVVSQTLTTVPQAPTIGSASTVSTTTAVTVTWTLNANGGKNLTSITITPYLNGTTAQTSQTATSTSATSHSFTGLTMGSAYTFKVKATNANGDSLESNATNSVTIPTIVEVDFLVVAGGGGSGRTNSQTTVGMGAGGGGGFRSSVTTSGGGAAAENKIYAELATNFTVTVGAGGAGGGGADAGSNGGNSVFFNITSTGGGGGAGNQNGAKVGGSGGGGGGPYGQGTGANGTTGQGYAGASVSGNSGGGGGGAGNAASGRSGGNGATTNINGNAVTYAGGGGGGASTSGGAGTGGGGNGGGGGTQPNGGTAGTGGGGGAMGNATNVGSTSGGSGIVILRYPANNTISVGAGLTSATTTSGNVKITTFNAGTGNVSWS